MALKSSALNIPVQARRPGFSAGLSQLSAGLWVARLALGAAIVAAWWWAGTQGGLQFFVANPLKVVQRIGALAATGELWIHLQATFTVALIGLVSGVVVGVAAGVGLGLSRRVAAVLEPYIMIFYTLPRIALAPLFIMLFGVGPEGKAVFAFTVVVFVALLNAFEGVRSVDAELVDAFRTMQAGRWFVIRWIILPSIVPWTLVTLRIGIGLALIGAIVAEGISASRGLGWYMTRSANTFDAAGVFAAMLVLSAVALLLNALITCAEARLLAWRKA